MPTGATSPGPTTGGAGHTRWWASITSGVRRGTVTAIVTGTTRGETAQHAVMPTDSPIDKDPDLLLNLDDLVEPDARGDPMCPPAVDVEVDRLHRRCAAGHGAPDKRRHGGAAAGGDGVLVAGHRQAARGSQHPDRGAQFVYLTNQLGEHLRAGQPVISIDTKRKEAVGQRSNGGKEYQPKGSPERVDVHDFPDPEVPKAIPFGVYDLAANEGVVVVGDDHDNAAFAVATIGRWWDMVGRVAYPGAHRLLITADAGGVQRVPGPGVEGRARPARGPRRHRHHRVPVPAGHEQVEPHRAEALERSHLQLARPTPDQPRGRRQLHRRDDEQEGLEGPGPPRDRLLPERGQGF